MATDISKMAAISLGLLSGPPGLLVNFFSSSFSVLVFLSCPHIFFISELNLRSSHLSRKELFIRFTARAFRKCC